MSADQSYFIKFAVPPSKKRIGEMIFAIIDALGAGAFLRGNKGGTDIYTPIFKKFAGRITD